jgi:hypothetical protein
MNRHVACLVFALVFVGVCSGQYDDRIAHLRDAPFSAEVQGSVTTRDSSSTWTNEIARASDGSVYKATVDPSGEFKGSIDHIKIEDATSNCNIGIYPYRSHLTKTNQGQVVGPTRGLSIGLDAAQVPALPFPTIEDIRDRNLREQGWISTGSQVFNPDAQMRQTSLGQRTVDGMTIFGFHLEGLHDSKTDRVEERWESELGFNYSFSRTYSTEGRVSAHSVAGLKLVEPPAALFAIQDKYFEPTNTLPNARTVFFPGFVGNAELTHRIESILTASGRFTIAPDSKSADLAVLVKIDSEIPGYKSTPPFHQILLKFNKPNGDSVIWVELHFRGASDEWAQSPVVNTCFANLWKRVESVQSPSASSDE